MNSLTKDNFIPLNLLEAHNSLFSYDVISLCETNLNATVDLPSNLFAIDNLSSALDLNQIICEPTNFEENKNSSCIDQPNKIVGSGVRPSLDPFCKHQIIYCNINFNMPSAPSYIRKVWHYNRANTRLIRRTISEFPWYGHLKNHDPNWQVECFNNTILNIMSNIIQNDYIKIQPKDPPWITSEIKRLIKKQNRFYKIQARTLDGGGGGARRAFGPSTHYRGSRFYKNYKRNRCKPEDQVAVDNFRIECFNIINIAKQNYLSNLGNQLNDPTTGPKAYLKRT